MTPRSRTVGPWRVSPRGPFLDVIDEDGKPRFTFDNSQSIRASRFAQLGGLQLAERRLREAAIEMALHLNDEPIDDEDSSFKALNRNMLQWAVRYAESQADYKNPSAIRELRLREALRAFTDHPEIVRPRGLAALDNARSALAALDGAK